jgi:hypothetical protein
MLLKTRRALHLAEVTRTVGAKTFWDPTLRGGAGDITTDIIPGWRLLLDPRTSDPMRMEFIGDRALMSRSRAMLMYPLAAERLNDNTSEQRRGAPTGAYGSAGSPMPGPWGAAQSIDPNASFPGAAGTSGTLINGKPVITAFTSRSPTSSDTETEVEVIELYYRDYSRHLADVPEKDADGNDILTIERDEEGLPLFVQDGPYDDILGEPGYRISMTRKMKQAYVPTYPFYRRTTILAPDMEVLDDRAWDAPHPYATYSANEPLEGSTGKGSIHEVVDLQACLNVSLSTMLDNLRFSAYRAFKASSMTSIDKANLVLSPGDIIKVGQDVNQFQPIEFPEVSQAWFGWVQLIITMMEKLIGLEGIMQGTAKDAPRADSAKAFDSLAEIGGSGVVECTQRFERFLTKIGENVMWWAQRKYTEAHAISVEDKEGNLTWERAGAPLLLGSLSCSIKTGSTLAWNASAIRDRVIQEYQLGFRDLVSVWQRLDIEDWPLIRERKLTQPPQMSGPPPPRTRTSAQKKPPQPKA